MTTIQLTEQEKSSVYACLMLHIREKEIQLMRLERRMFEFDCRAEIETVEAWLAYYTELAKKFK